MALACGAAAARQPSGPVVPAPLGICTYAGIVTLLGSF